MPQIPKHRKVKRASVLIRRMQYRSNPKNKSYKPLCEKLKSNNNSLAKALSKEKQESQLLFAQNVSLVAEVQDLGLACSKRDIVITNVLKNAKELLKMLVTATGFVTNTISSCQEFAASSNAIVQASYNPAAERESLRRLSTKSPARGVVKPMVSGHTITKPTINLSRVNTQHIYNASRLNIIHEVSPSPPRTQESSSPRSPVAVSITQRKRETGRTCRLPERLAVASPRINEESERRLSKRSNRHSGRISGKHSRSKSGRFSGNLSTRRSAENVEYIGSPRVKLNDVSKLLQNSQSINIRMLTDNQSNRIANSNNRDGKTDDSHQDSSQANISIIRETSSDDSTKNDSAQIAEKESNIEALNITKEPSFKRLDCYDPLEGPSWLLGNSQTVPCITDKDPKTNDANVSKGNDTTSSTNASISIALNNTVENMNAQEISPLPGLTKRANHAHNLKRVDKLEGNENLNNCTRIITVPKKRRGNVYVDDTASTSDPADSDENRCDEEKNVAVNMASFVTQRRRYVDSEDEEDFTLMCRRQPRNMNFDINDLRLPVLDTTAIKPLSVPEPEPELTTNVQKITQVWPLPLTALNNSMDESAFIDAAVRLPSLLTNDYEQDTSPEQDRHPVTLQKKKKPKNTRMKSSIDYVEPTLIADEHESKQRKKKKSTNNKDPSAVKVVLQKLNESDVKTRTPFSEEIYSPETLKSPLTTVALGADNSSDSETSSNASTSSVRASNRPRRRGAPLNLQEPSLRKKLRRNVD